MQSPWIILIYIDFPEAWNLSLKLSRDCSSIRFAFGLNLVRGTVSRSSLFSIAPFPFFLCDRLEDRREASTRGWTSTRAMHPAWKKRSLYCERYRQRTKTCNVQVSCTTRALHGRAHVAISCGKFRLDSTYVTSGRGVPPHRRLRFSPPLKEAPF